MFIAPLDISRAIKVNVNFMKVKQLKRAQKSIVCWFLYIVIYNYVKMIYVELLNELHVITGCAVRSLICWRIV